MDMFDYANYKLFVTDWISEKPNKGRGELKRISEFLKVSSVLISQIFNGHKEISLEQAEKLTEYLGLIELEKRFFLSLVSLSRAGTQSLKDFYQREAESLKVHSKDISKRVPHQNILNEKDKAIFYSDWKFSAIRLACGLNKVSKKILLKKFNLDEETLDEYIEFLASRGLIEFERGFFSMGPSSTHISKESPFVKQHHRNWRLKAIESIDKMNNDEIMYTAPMCISYELYEDFSKKVLSLIDDLVENAKDSKADDLYFFNLDLRRVD